MIERLRFDEQPDRLPPYSREAEEAVLGSVLIDAGVIDRVVGIVSPRDFYRDRHEQIFKAMRDLHDRAEPVDYLTLTAELDRTGKLDAAGGRLYVAELAQAVPTPIHAEHYARIVAEAGIKRRVISAGGKIAQIGFDRAIDAATTLEKAEQLLLEVASTRPTNESRPLADVLRDYLDQLALAREGEAVSRAIPTGYLDLDRILVGGLKRTDLAILAARPSLGKTSLATGIAAFAGMRLKAGVALFSLEMSAGQMAERLLSSESGVEASRLRGGTLTDAEQRRFGHALGQLAEAPIVIDDTGSLTPAELRARVRRISAETPLDLVIVDHIQLMASGDRGMNPVQQMTEISRQLKLLAKEQGVAVLALSQLSRAVEQRNPKIPMLSDLRESGSIEQDADVVVFLYREDRYVRDSERQGQADLIVAKHRNGPTGQVTLLFNERTTKFLDLADPQEGGQWWAT